MILTFACSSVMEREEWTESFRILNQLALPCETAQGSKPQSGTGEGEGKGGGGEERKGRRGGEGKGEGSSEVEVKERGKGVWGMVGMLVERTESLIVFSSCRLFRSDFAEEPQCCGD